MKEFNDFCDALKEAVCQLDEAFAEILIKEGM
jgi:hypothetical protein